MPQRKKNRRAQTPKSGAGDSHWIGRGRRRRCASPSQGNIFILTREHLDRAFAFAAIDAFITEIDPLDGATFARKVDDLTARSFSEFMPYFRLEGFIVDHCHDHVEDFDGRILNCNPKLSKPAFALADIDAVVIFFEVHLTLT